MFINVAVENKTEHGGHGVDGSVTDEKPVSVEGVGLEVCCDAVDSLTDGDNETTVDDELC